MKFKGPSGEIVKGNDAIGDSFVMTYAKICQEAEAKKKSWIEKLQGQGIKGAHPNDGWVNREQKIINSTYPQFWGNVQVNDKVALGDPEKYLIVTITLIVPSVWPVGYPSYHYK